MIESLTPNTQAILLLTAPLITGRSEMSRDLLSMSEYNRLARILREQQKQPADLLAADAGALVELCSQQFGRARLQALLERGFLMSQVVERWNARAIWVISRADTGYPKRLKARLKEDAPPVLYGCGERALLEKGGLAVVGSRDADEKLIVYTEKVGQLAAEARKGIISGGAKGVDRAAMNGALQSGGAATAVMADSLQRAAVARDHREPLMDGRLVLVSPYDPSAGFNVGHAMNRNKIIYALADVALVVASDFEKGGTWAGAIEQLEKLRYVPVFVRNGDNAGKGNAALINRGGKPWPDPVDRATLYETLLAAVVAEASGTNQESLPFVLREEPLRRSDEKLATAEPGSAEKVEAVPTPKDQLFDAVRKILKRELGEARSDSEVAELLGIPKVLAKTWLIKLVKEGVLEKLSKPVRYRTGGRLL